MVNKKGLIKGLTQWGLSLGVLTGAVLFSLALVYGRTAPERVVKAPQPLFVDGVKVYSQDEQIVVPAYGTVKAHRQVVLQPEVTGKVTALSPELVAGGIVKKGTTLVKIDERDYITRVDQERAAFARAVMEFKQELGRQEVAELEWTLLDSSIETTELQEELALREPQLFQKRAALEAARSALQKAELDLERTAIKAPFDGVISKESVEEGQLVNPQFQMLTLVSTEEFRIHANLPLTDLEWIDLPEDDADEGPMTLVYQELGDEVPMERVGELVKLLPEVDPQGRMAKLLISVKDPMGVEDPLYQVAPLLIGSYVRMDIDGPILQNLYSVPREAIREGNRIWVMNDKSELEYRDVEVVFSFDERVLLEKGVKNGDFVITSHLPVAIPGTPLQLIKKEG